MKLIVGLGNPGAKFERNRHNVGHRFAEFLIYNLKLKINFQISNFKFQIDKTDCFMNESGEFVRQEIRKAGIKDFSQLFIVHDDLDIPLGKFKIQFGIGPKVHNGILSIEEALGTKEFWRVRIGIDDRGQGAVGSEQSRMPGEEYVLEDFTRDELSVLDNLFPKIWAELQKKF